MRTSARASGRSALRARPATVIVVDDFDGPARFLLPCDEPVDWRMGMKPFVFARNINIGIRAAARATWCCSTTMRCSRRRTGSPPCSVWPQPIPSTASSPPPATTSGNRRQWPQNKTGVRDEPRMVCFVCVFIPRSTLEAVGLLDERFVGYGCDDDDYCLRVRKAGLENRDLRRLFRRPLDSQEHIPGTRPGGELPAQPEAVRREVGSVGGRASWDILSFHRRRRSCASSTKPTFCRGR